MDAIPGGAPQEAAIRCEGLTKRYGDTLGLDALDLAVPHGSIFGFLGRNGAGKTTTMRLLAGLALPTAGRAWVAGQEITGADRSGVASRAQFGYLPQAPAFYGWMSAYEYLDYIGQIRGMEPGERKRQAAELLDRIGLRAAAKRRIGGYSGGMIQSLGIAQALLGEPPVLLLDEPTSSLDPAGRSRVLDLLAGLRGRTTVFLSSHILSDIERVCDTLAVLHQGRLVLVSGRDELLARYPVNAAELELDPGAGDQSAQAAAFMAVLEGLPWAASVNREGSLIRVMVQDLARGKRDLLPLAAFHDLVLNRYAWVRPSLEEIFLELSA